MLSGCAARGRSCSPTCESGGALTWSRASSKKKAGSARHEPAEEARRMKRSAGSRHRASPRPASSRSKHRSAPKVWTVKQRAVRDRLEAALARIADPDGEGARACLTVYAQSARIAADAADARAGAGLSLGPLDGAI